MALLLLTATIIVCLIASIPQWSLRSRTPKGTRKLPGPWVELSSQHHTALQLNNDPGLPFRGRIHDVDPARIHFMLREWADVYGPNWQTTMMADVHIWISDPEVAKELMARRSHLYLDRPENPHMKGPKTALNTCLSYVMMVWWPLELRRPD
jgi:hypothetical protein